MASIIIADELYKEVCQVTERVIALVQCILL